ncbi:MAG: sigma 54-interacting transcriptional regulator [Magnetospiraceae bacterium]
MNKGPLLEQFNLRSRLRFDVDSGHIWLGESRMVLMHAKALGKLRDDLVATLGPKRAQNYLLRMSFTSGQHDAGLALKVFGEADNYDVFQIGPALHAFEGVVKSVVRQAEIDWEAGSFFGEVQCDNCWEADAHLQSQGITEDATCWTLLGYASGYVSQFFQRFVTFREVECRGRGHEHCVIVGKPAEAWEDETSHDFFITEPIDTRLFEMEEELNHLRGHQRKSHGRGKLVGQSPAFQTAFNLLSKATASTINVLLLGETGVGKEMFAQWLHDNGPRADKPFVAINCSAIPHDLIESELFGVEKGAFTGADKSRKGRFERADGGTLFLDEIGELTPAVQAKLLRVLQTGEIERLGDEETRKVNVRLIAATNVNLQEAITKGAFRSDLYFRLATYPVLIPPLRDRVSDIPLLMNAMIEKFADSDGAALPRVSERATKMLLAHPFPGNVRELENMIERAVLLAPPGSEIEVEHLMVEGLSPVVPGAILDPKGFVGNLQSATRDSLYDALLSEGFSLKEHEEHLIDLAVERSGGNLTHAAELLGITRRQLAYRLKHRDLTEEDA